MIVRMPLLLAMFLLFSACGTGQDPQSTIVDTARMPVSVTLNKDKYGAQIKERYEKLLNKNFSGEILVAKNGEIVFEDYQGFVDLVNKTPIDKQTSLHLASISKTFTAMATLKLWEEQKIDLKATVTKYLPKFPYTQVTVEQLLCHRSGLPDYAYFLETVKYVDVKTKNKKGKIEHKLQVVSKVAPFKEGNYSNQDVLDYMVQKRPAPQAQPNKVFKYCNTNYVLLALIIEQVTGKDFPTYIDETIFKPLKMEHSFIFSNKLKDKYVPSYNEKNQPFKLDKFDCIYGDKNVYSTVQDMLLWDKALRSASYVKQSTMDLAYEPKSPLTKDFRNYGFGWRMVLKPNEEKLIFHNGWWHGNNAVFARLLKDSVTIIILGNKYNKKIYNGKQLVAVFTGKEDSTLLEQ
jgi:CubicO group peptidase (beta-lactamase class C family)